MKKTVLTVMALCLALGAFAQFEQGRMMIGGQLSIQSHKEKVKSGSTTTAIGNTTNYSFTPQFGYFVIDNLALGAGLITSFEKFNADDNDLEFLEYTASSFQLQPFVRYYLPQRIFFQGAFGIGSGSEKDYEGDKESFGVSSWSLAAGYAVMLNESVAVEPILGYGATTHNYKDDDYKDIFGGLFIQVGLQVYIGK